MKGKLIALLVVLALASGLGAAFAVAPLFFGNTLTGPTVTVAAPTAFTLTWVTMPPTSATLGGQSYATFTVANTNKIQIADYALFVNVTGTGVTPTCVSSGDTCVTIRATQVSQATGFVFGGLFACFGSICPIPNSTPQEDLITPMTVPAGTTLITLAITYGATGTFILHVSFLPDPTPSF